MSSEHKGIGTGVSNSQMVSLLCTLVSLLCTLVGEGSPLLLSFSTFYKGIVHVEKSSTS